MTGSIAPADSDDLVDVMRLFDGALLETDPDRIRDQLTGSRGCILLATSESRPVGAVALTTEEIVDRPAAWDDAVHITAIAVSKARRGQGIGRDLIAAAAEWATPRPLSATFDERVQPFYTACGFAVEEREGRLWGRLSTRR